MRKLVFFIIILSVIGPLRGQTSYDVEYAQVCLIDSIAPDTVIQFWRFTQANNPGEYSVDMTFDLASSYTVEGTVLPCCSCLTEAMAANGGGGGGIGDIAMANPPPINALLLLSGAVLLALIIPRRKIAVLLILAAPAAVSAQPGTTYDIEHTCICLVDSIAADTVIQFWRFTQSNNPGSHTVDVTFDLGGSYTVAGTVLSCKDFYLGDNPGGSGTANTLAMWTGTSSLGNSSVTQSGTVLSSSFTGAFKPPSGTTVEQPAGSPGYFRFNTTASGFEGYNGSAYRFLPWADADNWTTGYVPFSNGAELTTSANLKYLSSELLMSGITDQGNYILQGTGGYYFTGQSRIIGSMTSANGLYVDNSHASGWGTEFDGELAGANITVSSTTSNQNLYLGQKAALSTTSIYPAITIGYGSNPAEGTSFTLGAWNDVGQGRSINWKYGRNQNNPTCSQQFYSAARIVPTVTFSSCDSVDTNMEFWIANDYTLVQVAEFARAGTTMNFYGAGNITGTHAYSISVNSSGRLIEIPEKWGAINTSTDGSGDIVVAHGMAATPTSVQVTVTGTTPYVVTVHTIGATNFTVRFFDMAGAAVASTAVTATWHAKT